MQKSKFSIKLLGKERPIEVLVSTALLIIGAVYSIAISIPDFYPVTKFSGFVNLVIGIVLLLGSYYIFSVESLETGMFVAAGFGLIWIIWNLAGGTIQIGLLLRGIFPLLAGLLCLRAQRETKRKIWIRRVKGFWFEFSHNRIGLVGLAILLVFIFIAIFQGPIAALSYPNPDQKELAEHYAKPSWIGLIDPSARNYPPTINYTFNWQAEYLPENVTIEQQGSQYIVRYAGDEEVVVVFNATVHYPYDAPYKFSYNFSWGATPGYVGTVATARYSLELNLTKSDGTTMPLWDQHWWKYKASQCWLANPDYTGGPNTEPKYYPGGNNYTTYYEHKASAWSTPLYDRPAYGIYDAYYGGDIPTWTTNVTSQRVDYTTTIYPCIRMGFRQDKTRDLTNALFSPSGDLTFQMYVTIVPTQNNATCEVRLTGLFIRVPGLVWGLLGTDYEGKDCWSRLIYGARVSIAVGLAAAVMGTSIGIFVGIVAGYRGGVVDEALMRFVDILLCLPVLPLLMVLVTFFGRNIIYIILIIAVFGWQGLSRLIRSQVLSIREAPFIESAVASGAPGSYVMTRHLLPNVLPVALADFILSVPGAILLEAALSYIGFGDPSTPTWGREYSQMQDAGNVFVVGQGVIWWWFIPPGIAITLLCVAFVFIGHAVDEIVNPKLRRRR